jgi:hypothetical protein
MGFDKGWPHGKVLKTGQKPFFHALETMSKTAGLVIFFTKPESERWNFSSKTINFLKRKFFGFQTCSGSPGKVFASLDLLVFEHKSFCEKSWTCDFFQNLEIPVFYRF